MKPEVIIVGGGVIGTACAYFLSRRGVRVLILEGRHLGAGSSGAAASMINTGDVGGTSEALRPFVVESPSLILELAKDFDRPLEIIRGGSLYVAMNEQEAGELKPLFDEARVRGIECELLDGPEARRLEPLLGPEVVAAFHNPINYHVNPFRLCEGYLHGAVQRGADIAYGIMVGDVKVRNDRIDLVVTDRGDYYADWVVVAAGAHTPRVLSSMGIEIPIVPARGQAIITEACPPMTNHALQFLSDFYVKQTAIGNFYLSGHTEFEGFKNQITFETIATYIRMLSRAVPSLARLRALRFFAGFRPMSADNLPVIGPVPNCSRLILASGHGRTGIRYSASTGKAVSELIIDGKTELPIDAFAVDRFAQ